MRAPAFAPLVVSIVVVHGTPGSISRPIVESLHVERMQHGARSFASGDDQLTHPEVHKSDGDCCECVFDQCRGFLDAQRCLCAFTSSGAAVA